jgi:hypothetical protein
MFLGIQHNEWPSVAAWCEANGRWLDTGNHWTDLTAMWRDWELAGKPAFDGSKPEVLEKISLFWRRHNALVASVTAPRPSLLRRLIGWATGRGLSAA